MTASIWDPSTPAGATAATVPFTPTATIAATDVQAAIEEADTENRALSAAAAQDVVDLENALLASSGSALVGYFHAGSGAVATTVQAKLRETVSVKDYGAVGDGVTDDTAAILAADAAVFAAGGGVVHYPRGNYRVTTLPLSRASSNVTVIHCGSGQFATYITKIAGTTTPIFNVSASASDGIYSEWSDMCLVGNASLHHGFQLTNVARTVFRNVRITGCDVGIENLGSLILSLYDCNIVSSNIGYRSRKSSGIWCNLIQFFGGAVRACSTFALDIGDANGVFLIGLDLEENGTAANTATGALMIRSTCGTETGFGIIGIQNGWFEGNRGRTIQAEAATGCTVTLSNTSIIGPESGSALNIGAVASLVLEKVIAAGPGDTLTVAAANCVIRESTINTLADTSTSHTYENLTTGSGFNSYEQKSAAGTISYNGNGMASARGFTSALNATATTLLTAGSAPGIFLVYASLDGGGAAYMANARVVWDGANLVRMGGENGADLTLTTSGTNIQVTQTSGVTQNVRWSCLKVA